MTRHIVLIAPHGAMIDCARFYDIDITLIDKSDQARQYHELLGINALFYDYHDLRLSECLLRALHDVRPIDAIITLTEKALRIAAELSTLLQLPTLPLSVIELIHDKNTMRAFLGQYDDFSIRYAKPGCIEELSQFAANNGFPFIVKPVDGYGSQDVKKIIDHEQLQEIDFSTSLVVEEYLAGDEYSVECFSFNGEHLVIAITRKMLMESPHRNSFTEMGHCVPAALTKNDELRIREYIKRFLSLIGINNGPSHTEIKVSEDVIRVIETHNRIGGDRISSLVKISTGVDMVELSILWPLGLCAPILEIPSVRCHTAIRFFNPPVGKLESLVGVEMLRYSPAVIDAQVACQPGDDITPIMDSFNRYGFVIATGGDETQAINNSVAAVKKVLFNTIE